VASKTRVAGKPDDTPTTRPQRADAQRNYERLITAARDVFAEDGGSASMEAIARAAGVGVGTLYRHFPQRIDVVEAVYRDDVDQLVATADQAIAEFEPWPAVVAFLEAFARYAHGKRTFLNELHDAFDKHPELKLRSKERIDDAMDRIIRRAQDADVIRADVSGAELMQLVSPLCINATLSKDQSSRLLNMILDGLRHQS
jgi:AcrR family transcriptional regulator